MQAGLDSTSESISCAAIGFVFHTFYEAVYYTHELTKRVTALIAGGNMVFVRPIDHPTEVFEFICVNSLV